MTNATEVSLRGTELGPVESTWSIVRRSDGKVLANLFESKDRAEIYAEGEGWDVVR